MSNSRTDLSLQKAANLLNVSRAYLNSLVDAGEIVCLLKGKSRRIERQDLAAFKLKRDADRADVLTDMARADSDNGDL